MRKHYKIFMNKNSNEEDDNSVVVKGDFGRSLEGEQTWPPKLYDHSNDLVREVGNPVDNIMMIPNPNAHIMM